MVAQTVKNLPAWQETQVQSLGLKNPLEKEMATHSSILACKITWTLGPGTLQSWDGRESGIAKHTRKPKIVLEIRRSSSIIW